MRIPAVRACITTFRLVTVIALVAAIAGLLTGPSHTQAQPSERTEAAALQSGCPASSAGAADTVQTATGTFRGVRADAVTVFKGIPYAAPPVGELRWKPTVAASCRPGVTDASTFGSDCLQVRDDLVQGSEDCLFLNIWVPSAPNLPRPLPVMVWIHGGGNAYGAGSYKLYDGARLAGRGSAIVVNLNYRLGPLGYLVLPELNAESPHGVSGNYGILDQIEALRWVNANIAAFGGDPSRLLVFGESGGGHDICGLIASPLAAGLFTRALMESPPCDYKTMAQMQAADAPYVGAAGCSGAANVPACLRGLSGEQAIRALPSPSILTLVGLGANPYYATNIDGYVFPEAPLTIYQKGAHTKVPVVAGSNADEAAMAVSISVRTDADYEAAVTKRFGSTAGAALLRLYPASDFASPRAAMIALYTDIDYTCQVQDEVNALVQNQTQPVYRYVFSDALTGPLSFFGAFHGSEMFYVFGSYPLLSGGGLQVGGQPQEELLHLLLGRDLPGNLSAIGGNPADQALSDAIMDYWARFAATGDPNGGDAVAWPKYNSATGPYLTLGKRIAGGRGYHTAECDAIATILAGSR